MKLLNEFTEEEKISFKKGQEIMTNMLKEFVDICNENSIKYWLMGGTLMGTILNKGWLAHDGRIDIGMLEQDYEDLEGIIDNNLSTDCWFQCRSNDSNYKLKTGKVRYLRAFYKDDNNKEFHNGLEINITLFQDRRKFFVPLADLSITMINSEMIFPLKTLKFETIDVSVPHNYEVFNKFFNEDYPSPDLPTDKLYSPEGRISFDIPEWITAKYTSLYNSNQ